MCVNLMLDALSRREKLNTLRLLMLIEEHLDEVEKDLFGDVMEGMKHDEDAIMKDRFFNKQGL